MFFKKDNDGYVLMKSHHQQLIENPNIYGENRLDPRCTVIPSRQRDVFVKNRFSSDMILSLNGDYKFLYTEDSDNDDYYRMEYDDSTWDVLSVPSMWQYHGYGYCTYPNVRYHFPFDPPYIRCANPVGIYRKRFIYNKDFDRCILHFSGVISAYFIYLNGEYVGFAKGSRNAAEFDVTNILRNGENLIVIKVYTWSDASYLENQDMLNANGIFRDVYLIKTSDTHVWDYALRTDISHIYADIIVSNANDHSWIKLICNGEDIKVPVADGKASWVFVIDNPKLWTAETPNTYTVYIELYHDEELLEVHSKRVGLRTCAVIGNKFLVNGKPIMFKGVNRHEHNRKNGMAISDDQMVEELKIIKEFNLNAVRCAHYTNHPLFYELATEYGLYVFDEADMESHGAEVTGDQGLLSKMKEWEYAYLFRTRCMIENNKNESCIVIWSIGNELGRGINRDKCSEYIRNSPYALPIYQAQNKLSPYDDFRKNGYCTLEDMADDFHGPEGKPVMLAEYAHGMGNIPGNLKEYWDYMYTHEQYCGGFVWEFKSHGFYAEDENGVPYSKFGGDFSQDELNHWLNFTIDGYLKSDLTPKPGFYELKEAVAPVRISLEDQKIICTNTNDFIDLSYLTLRWKLLEDYSILREGNYDMPAIPARESEILDIPLAISKVIPGAVYRVDLRFFDGDREVSHKQVKLPMKAEKERFAPKPFEYRIHADKNEIAVFGKRFEITFIDGLPVTYRKDGNTIFDGRMKFNFFRAVTDNDHIKRSSSVWEINRMHAYQFTSETVKVTEEKDRVCINVFGKATHQGLASGFMISSMFSVLEDGMILSEIHVTPYGQLHNTMLRFGVCFEMAKDFNNVTWFGRGGGENYCDRTLSAPFGLYSKNIKDMNFRYEVPQECGTRTDVRFASVSNEKASFNIIGCDDFSFSYHDFTLENLNCALHENELKTADHNYLYIDYAMRGLGNHSCGPDPLEKYELRPHEFQFAFIMASNLDTDTANALAKMNFGIKSKKITECYENPTFERIIQLFACDLQ